MHPQKHILRSKIESNARRRLWPLGVVPRPRNAKICQKSDVWAPAGTIYYIFVEIIAAMINSR